MISSEFISKIEFVCNKKESLYSQSKFKYAIRSMFAGAFLTFSTAAGAVGADLINKIAPGSGRFLFPFVFAWGLAYIVFLNAELVTSNMMFLTAGSFLKKISWRKTAEILLYCTLFNLIGALIAGWGFAHSAAYANLTHDSFISGVVEMKLGRSNELVLLEAILANIFVNIAILSFILVKDGGAKLWLVLFSYLHVCILNKRAHCGELCFFRDCEIQCCCGFNCQLRCWKYASPLGCDFHRKLYRRRPLDGSSICLPQ